MGTKYSLGLRHKTQFFLHKHPLLWGSSCVPTLWGELLLLPAVFTFRVTSGEVALQLGASGLNPSGTTLELPGSATPL